MTVSRKFLAGISPLLPPLVFLCWWGLSRESAGLFTAKTDEWPSAGILSSQKDYHRAAPRLAKQPVGELVSKLGDAKQEVEDEIVRRGADAVEPLAKVLHDEKKSYSPRIEAALLLGRIGGKEAVASLRLALSDRHPNVQDFAVVALGDVGPAAREALPDLARLLRQRLKEKTAISIRRDQTIEALAKIGGNSQEAVDALVLCLKRGRYNEATLALTKFGEPGAEALVTLAASYSRDDRPEEKRRHGDVYSVVAWGSPPLPKEMIPVFKKHFEHGDRHARLVAYRALAGVGPPAIPVLAKYLDDKNPDFRADAAEGLATMNWFARRGKKEGEKVAVPVSADEFFPRLKKLYKLPDGKVDHRIVSALLGIDRDRFWSDPEMVKVEQEEFAKALMKAAERPKE